jgi:hypothetical protein
MSGKGRTMASSDSQNSDDTSFKPPADEKISRSRTTTKPGTHGTGDALGLPLVVQLSFAGSRTLFDAKLHPHVDRDQFEREVERLLAARIKQLGTDLKLTSRHFWCGLSQIAIGGDTVFTRACKQLDIPQRIYLPQHRECYLAARGSSGTDFSDDQLAIARDLLASPHIIQERVVAASPDRHEQFEEVNRQLARAADVMICLVRDDAQAKRGGSLGLLELADRRRQPLLEIRVSVGADNGAVFREVWHHRESFELPDLPHELAGLQLDSQAIPSVKPFCDALKAFASDRANSTQAIFKYSALTIVGTHFLATLCAVWALRMVNPKSSAVSRLLGIELVLLLAGFAAHQLLHWRHASAVWGMTRLVAELARSVLALANVRMHLGHLFTLPMPESLRPLLHTLNVLHLREAQKLSPETFAVRRERYACDRFLKAGSGQIAYYEGKLKSAKRWMLAATVVFLTGSLFAFLATSLKLALHHGAIPEIVDPQREKLTHWLGSLAILLPMLAVAGLSLSASLDLQARISTYREMLDFLKVHGEHLREAASEREFDELAIEAETRLLSETVTWYFRRSYTSVA